MGSTWPSNGGSYNWDAGLLSSWNASLSSAFSRWGNAGRGAWASHLVIAVVLKRKPRTLYFLLDVVLDVRLELCICNAGFKLWRGPQALCLSTEVVLRCRLWTLRLGIAMVLRCGLRTLRFAFAQVALISLVSETWTLLSDDLSSVIFRLSIHTRGLHNSRELRLISCVPNIRIFPWMKMNTLMTWLPSSLKLQMVLLFLVKRLIMTKR